MAMALTPILGLVTTGSAQYIPYDTLWTAAPPTMPSAPLQSIYPLSKTLGSMGLLLSWMQAPLGMCMNYYDNSGVWSADAAYNLTCLSYLDRFAVGDVDLTYTGGNGEFGIVGTSRNAGIDGAPCNGTGYFIYITQGDCRTAQGGTPSRAATWAVNGPRTGALLKFCSSNGWILFGGTSVNGTIMTDVWYTTMVIYGNLWYRGGDLPAECFDATLNTFTFTEFHSRTNLFLFCPNAAGDGTFHLYSANVGFWSLVGTTTLAMNVTRMAAVLAPIGDAASSPLQHVYATTQGAGAGTSPDSSPHTDDLSAARQLQPGQRLDPTLCFAAVDDTGRVFVTLDGLAFRDTGALAPTGPRVDYGLFPSWPGLAILGGQRTSTWLGDLWKAGPQLCCVTGYDAPSASYEVCSGHGGCSGVGSTSCVCTGGWTGDLCDVIPSLTRTPAATPSPRPSTASGNPITPPVMAGIVVGAIAGATLLGASVCIVRRRLHRGARTSQPQQFESPQQWGGGVGWGPLAQPSVRGGCGGLHQTAVDVSQRR